MSKIWFQGNNSVKCNLNMVDIQTQDMGRLFVGLVTQMSGITQAELIEQDEHSVVIKTNEGQMTRNNITKESTGDKIILEFDEEYVAGKAITSRSHYVHEFEKTEDGFRHTLTISDVKASGILGFFYKLFGSKNIGKDVLKSVESYFLALDSFPKQ